MKEQFDISDDYPNTYGRDEITCPYCGLDFGDSWERDTDHGIERCDDCEKDFKWVRHVSIKYESEPINQSSL